MTVIMAAIKTINDDSNELKPTGGVTGGGEEGEIPKDESRKEMKFE